MALNSAQTVSYCQFMSIFSEFLTWSFVNKNFDILAEIMNEKHILGLTFIHFSFNPRVCIIGAKDIHFFVK